MARLTIRRIALLDNDLYSKILNKVSEGVCISKACRSVGVDRTKLYRSITAIQKAELLAQSKVSKVSKSFGNLRAPGDPTPKHHLSREDLYFDDDE